MSTEIDDHLIDEIDESAVPIQYRSLSGMAILGMVVAVFSILTIFHWLFLIIPATASRFFLLSASTSFQLWLDRSRR